MLAYCVEAGSSLPHNPVGVVFLAGPASSPAVTLRPTQTFINVCDQQAGELCSPDVGPAEF